MARDNRYAPPKALALELPEQAPDSCRHVEWACRLLWIGFGLTILTSLLTIFFATDSSDRNRQIISQAIALAIVFPLVYWCVLKLRAGRNWMRLLITIINVLGFVFTAILVVILLSSDYGYGFFSGFFEAAPIESISILLQLGLSASQVILINTSVSRAWFAARKLRAGG